VGLRDGGRARLHDDEKENRSRRRGVHDEVLRSSSNMGPLHVNKKAVGSSRHCSKANIFPVRFVSFTCSRTRHVGSMFDEDRHTNTPPFEEPFPLCWRRVDWVPLRCSHNICLREDTGGVPAA